MRCNQARFELAWLTINPSALSCCNDLNAFATSSALRTRGKYGCQFKRAAVRLKLGQTELVVIVVRVVEKPRATHGGQYLAQQIQALGVKLRCHTGEAGAVCTRKRQSCRENATRCRRTRCLPELGR